MRHLRWPLRGFETAQAMTVWSDSARRAKTTRYPIRYMRYWFARSALAELQAQLGRPLRVLEVGVDRGDMLCFMGGLKVGADCFALPDWIERWDGFDVQFDPDVLARFSYSDSLQVNIEDAAPDWHKGRRYDAVVLLHVLEHLLDPEAAMAQLLPVLEPGGILVGGSPTMPSLAAVVHEPQLRRKYADRMHDVRIHKHLSVITPRRMRRFARVRGLAVEFLAGSFFMRASGSRLENSAGWIRANLLWGALFPALGGEVYFCFRKTAVPAQG